MCQRRWKDTWLATYWEVLTRCRFSVSMGCLRVSVSFLAGARFGFDEGVWTAQQRMNSAITTTNATAINSTAHQ